jgi:hypothetical protein
MQFTEPTSSDSKPNAPQLSEAEIDRRMEVRAKFRKGAERFQKKKQLEMDSQIKPEVKKTAFEYNSKAEEFKPSGSVPVCFKNY